VIYRCVFLIPRLRRRSRDERALQIDLEKGRVARLRSSRMIPLSCPRDCVRLMHRDMGTAFWEKTSRQSTSPCQSTSETSKVVLESSHWRIAEMTNVGKKLCFFADFVTLKHNETRWIRSSGRNWGCLNGVGHASVASPFFWVHSFPA